MKKIFVTLFSLFLVLVLFGCAKDKRLTEPAQTTAESTTESLTVKLTFPEGYTALEIAEKLQKNKVCSVADFMKAAQSEELAEKFGFLGDRTSVRSCLKAIFFPTHMNSTRAKAPKAQSPAF